MAPGHRFPGFVPLPPSSQPKINVGFPNLWLGNRGFPQVWSVVPRRGTIGPRGVEAPRARRPPALKN